MRKWAYLYEIIPTPNNKAGQLIDRLDTLGAQGWGLCGMLKAEWYKDVGLGVPCVFKRPGDVIERL